MTTKKAFCQPVVDSDTVAELSKKLLEANNELKKAETERKAMLENISHALAKNNGGKGIMACLKQICD